MSIRYYLLLIAGVTTTLVFLGSYFLESFLLNKSLDAASQASVALYDEMFSKRKSAIEDYIKISLVEKLSRINSILGAIAEYKPLAEWFSPSLENIKRGTWSNAASLIEQDEWIDFLQNTKDNQLLSLIIPKKGPFCSMRSIPIEEGLSWIYVPKEDGSFTPFIGIAVPNKLWEDNVDDGVGTFGVLPDVCVVYSIDKLRGLDFSSTEEDLSAPYIPIPFTQGVEIDEKSFLRYLARSMDLVHQKDLSIPIWIEEEPLENEQKTSFQGLVKEEVKKRASYGSELFLIWEASVLKQLGAFGVKQFYWPDAMTFSLEGTKKGEVFFLDPVIAFSHPVFEDSAFFAGHRDSASFVSSGSAVVRGGKSDAAFLVNTAILFNKEAGGEEKQSFLTIGMELNDLLENIVLTSQCYGLIYSGGEVLVNKAPDGKNLLPYEKLYPILQEQMHVTEGRVSFEGVCYHFFRMQPDPDLDLSFFLFNPKRDAFDFSYNFQVFQEKMKDLMEKLEMDRRLLEVFGVVVLWLLLLRLSKQITRPVIALSKALQQVKRGAWDQIQFPTIRFRKGNEIKMLCDSFHDMVEGMKEKEKVTGILNKVVSPEIAKEILKGEISLGGEERIVTILFVDIRGFTQMTQNMPPQEVVGLLNACMTKLSALVESHKGVIDKYTGDGLMALYGAPVAFSDHALQAVYSALAMLDSLKMWNEVRQKDGLIPVSIGIGIHTGSVCAGNMGAQNRLNYTVIGRHVNLASRLCSAAEPGEVLITEEVSLQEAIKEHFVVQDRGLISLKGFSEQQHIFTVIEKT